MGWASGSSLFSDIIEVMQEHILDEVARKNVYKKLIDKFQDQDWDTEMECLGEDPAYDAALKELHPDWFDDEDDKD